MRIEVIIKQKIDCTKIFGNLIKSIGSYNVMIKPRASAECVDRIANWAQ